MPELQPVIVKLHPVIVKLQPVIVKLQPVDIAQQQNNNKDKLENTSKNITYLTKIKLAIMDTINIPYQQT